MSYIKPSPTKPIKLSRDLTKHIKQGNPWVFSDALIPSSINAQEGSFTPLLNNKNEILCWGIYNPNSNLAYRVVSIGKQCPDDKFIESILLKAISLRGNIDREKTNCFRLINGEGDRLPGLICDVYNNCIVIQFDGKSCQNFWDQEQIANFLKQHLNPDIIYVKYKSGKDRAKHSGPKGELLLGNLDQDIIVKENSILFSIDIINSAKTGLFLDQRDSREFISKFSKHKSLLNLFGYTGGFSLAAGAHGANEVWTVDISTQAISASKKNWAINNLDPQIHKAIDQDAFEFLEEAKKSKKLWDIVVADPPSFAPSEQSVANAQNAYLRLFTESIKVTASGGLFAASSCSAHIGHQQFLEIVQKAVSNAKRRAVVLELKGQPFDHPFPLACQELRYLKFYALQIE